MIIVNPSTRQLNIPGSDLTFGVEADAGSERKYFQCPRYVGNKLDIASSFVRINYRNANGEIDSYLVEDITVDGDNVLFSWELYPKVTAYKGQLKFVMCVTGPDTKVAWHTTLGTGIVLEGLEPDYAAIQAGTADVVAQLIALTERQSVAVENKGAEWVRNVQSEGTDQIVAVQTAGAESKAAAVAEIEAKGKNVRESIPDDYTSLGNAVDSLIRGRAGAIVCEVEGTAISVKDASNMAIQGLRIFGRSTQDGVPTPANPVEIVSVESPVVTVAGKNLLTLPYWDGVSKTHGGVTYTVNPDGSVHAVGTVTATSSHFILNAVYFGDQNISEGFSNGKHHWTDCLYNSSNKYTMIYLVKGVEVDKTFYPMVSLGTAPSEFETPRETQASKTTHPLRGIPVTTGGNYTDENGQQWISDEVDLERGVYVQRVSRRVFNGSESAWRRGTFTSGEMLNYVYSTDSTIENVHQSICTHAVFNTSGGHWHNGLYMRSGSGLWQTLTDMTLDEWKAYLSEQASSGTPVTLCYPISAPIQTPLSEAEIAAYRTLHTNKPNTTILNDSGAHMKVEYAADTKLYIDNKLAALVGNT